VTPGLQGHLVCVTKVSEEGRGKLVKTSSRLVTWSFFTPHGLKNKSLQWSYHIQLSVIPESPESSVVTLVKSE